MKHIFIPAIAAVCLGNVTLAGTVETQIAPVVIMAAAPSVTDWSGFYAGGMLGATTGTYLETSGSTPDSFDMGGYTFGGFGGYNFQSGAMVYGVELAYSLGNIPIIRDLGYAITGFLEANVRVGYAFDDILVYATVGATKADWKVYSTTPTTNGYNVGAGVDYMLTDHFIVGAEYLYRDFDIAAGVINLWTGLNSLHSIQIKAAYKF